MKNGAKESIYVLFIISSVMIIVSDESLNNILNFLPEGRSVNDDDGLGMKVPCELVLNKQHRLIKKLDLAIS